MISIDPYIVEFVTKNPITCSLILSIPKVLALWIPSVEDSKVTSMIRIISERVHLVSPAKKKK